MPNPPATVVYGPMALLGALLLISPAALQAQEALSAPIGQPLSSSLYSESQQTGPSASLLPGGTNLTSAFVRAGISDPLGFLIESGYQSPYLSNGGLAETQVETSANSGTLTDPILASRYSEYRNNRLLMAGAGFSSVAGRAGSVGTTLSASGARPGTVGSAAFGRGTMLRPFAAGSSALAGRGTGMTSSDTFLDPNALLAAALANPAAAAGSGASGEAEITGQGSLGTGGVNAAQFGGIVTPISPLSPPTVRMDAGSLGENATMESVPGFVQFGPAPGQPFPLLTASSESGTGFPDSTMGTAGSHEIAEDANLSPLLSAHLNGIGGMGESSGLSNRLNPTLRGGGLDLAPPPLGAGLSSAALSEYVRKARMDALIRNPRAPLPTPFEQRAIVKAYIKDHRRGRSRPASHYPSVIVPTFGTTPAGAGHGGDSQY